MTVFIGTLAAWTQYRAPRKIPGMGFFEVPIVFHLQWARAAFYRFAMMNAKLLTLDFIAGCLGVRGELEENDALRRTVEAERIDWRLVISVANNELVTPALWVALRNRRLVEYLPSEVREYLREIHGQNTKRNVQLRSQAAEAVSRLNAIGVTPLLLKGAAGLFVETFPDPGSRLMADLDILVPKAATEDCWQTLCGAGYQPIEDSHTHPGTGVRPVDYDRHHHLRPLCRRGDYATVEIHRAAVPETERRLLPDELIWGNAETIEASGSRMLVPGPTARVAHNLVHSALMNGGYARGSIPLRSLDELAQIQIRNQDRIEWQVIRRLFESANRLKTLRDVLYLGHRLFAYPLPEPIDPTLGSMVYYARARLQTRSEWIDGLVAQALRFSSESIRERYQCGSDFPSLAKGRTRLAGTLVAKSAARTLRWIQGPAAR